MKTVIVTGVAQGIGKAIHDVLSKSNYDIIGIDIKDAPFCAKFIKGDLADPKFIENLPLLITEPISGIVNNAAIIIDKNIQETSIDEWEKVFKVNVHAPFLLIKTFLNKLGPGASIINISSVHARATSQGLAAYAASKGALSAMTRAMALELALKQIRVNAILPGAIDTPMLANDLIKSVDPRMALDKLKYQSPLQRIGTPTDIAALSAFLMNSDLSGNITGQEFVCDSGILAKLAFD